MLFVTHLLVAALAAHLRKLPPAWAVVGAALPDVVDKPLGMVGVTELFHTVGHSLVLVVFVPLALRYGRAGTAVVLGWASHLVLDAVHVVVNGRPDDALFLFWPVVVPPTPLGIPPGSFFFYYLWSPSFFLEVVLWLVAAGVVVRWRVSDSGA